MKLKGKKAVVLGAGISGIAAQEFLRRHGAYTVVYEEKAVPTRTHDRNDIETDTDCESIKPIAETMSKYDFCVISPGISFFHPMATAQKGRIISELNLGLQGSHGRVVAVTGTNGKTTVVNLINDAINASRNPFVRKSVLCGNVGVPVTAVAHELRRKTAVAEVSSFMMEPEVFQNEELQEFKKFKPDIAVILNITQDHLERHGSMENYIACKAAVSKYQTKRDILILNYDCEITRTLGERPGTQRVFYFSAKSRVRGIYIDRENVVLNIRKYPKILFPLSKLGEKKAHQVSNILAATLAAKFLGVSSKAVLKACKGGRRLENRIKHVGTVGQVMFFNDSKATNTAASLAACSCFQICVHLLLGGISKGQNFDVLFKNLPMAVERIFCFGASAEEIELAAKRAGFVNIVRTATMAEAVGEAFYTGSGPRIVLLSPACSSFDEFENYQHRGRVFVQTAEAIFECFKNGEVWRVNKGELRNKDEKKEAKRKRKKEVKT